MKSKIVIPGQVEKQSNKKFKIKKEKSSERDVEVEIVEDASIKITKEINYQVDKLSMVDLPAKMPDGKTIRWFNNFSIKKDGQILKQKFLIAITGLSSLGTSRVVILDSKDIPYYYEKPIINDTIELADGDPAVGAAP